MSLSHDCVAMEMQTGKKSRDPVESLQNYAISDVGKCLSTMVRENTLRSRDVAQH